MRAPNDIGLYLWTILKAAEETTLFPELFEVLNRHSRGEAIRSIVSHPLFADVAGRAASNHDLPVDKLRAAVVEIAKALHDHDRPHQFDLLIDFVDIFGGTRLDVPARDKFHAAVRDASIYWAYIDAGGGDAGIARIVESHRVSPVTAAKTIERVGRVLSRFGEVGDGG